MHVKGTRKMCEAGEQRKWVREWPRSNVSTERNRMEPARDRSLVQAARLDAPGAPAKSPGLCQYGPSKEPPAGQRWSLGPSPLVRCLHACHSCHHLVVHAADSPGVPNITSFEVKGRQHHPLRPEWNTRASSQYKDAGIRPDIGSQV